MTLPTNEPTINRHIETFSHIKLVLSTESECITSDVVSRSVTQQQLSIAWARRAAV